MSGEWRVVGALPVKRYQGPVRAVFFVVAGRRESCAEALHPSHDAARPRARFVGGGVTAASPQKMTPRKLPILPDFPGLRCLRKFRPIEVKFAGRSAKTTTPV